MYIPRTFCYFISRCCFFMFSNLISFIFVLIFVLPAFFFALCHWWFLLRFSSGVIVRALRLQWWQSVGCLLYVVHQQSVSNEGSCKKSSEFQTMPGKILSYASPMWQGQIHIHTLHTRLSEQKRNIICNI